MEIGVNIMMMFLLWLFLWREEFGGLLDDLFFFYPFFMLDHRLTIFFKQGLKSIMRYRNE